MPYLLLSCDSDGLDSAIEGLLRRKAQPDAVPTPLLEDVNSLSSQKGESSSTATSSSSYDQLPDYMRSCLDYICCRTMNYHMKIDKVIRLLVAEGLVQEKPGDTMEDVAANIIEEFNCLGMLEKNFMDENEVKVRSPYRELCVHHMEREKFVADSQIRVFLGDNGKDIHPNFRGLPVTSLFLVTAERQGLCQYGDPEDRLSRDYLESICRLKLLQVLDLEGMIECLPDEIGNLVDLTYLGLDYSHLDVLPQTVGNLQNLQTLDLTFCQNLKELPVEVLNMQQLRHLLMSHCKNNGEIRVPKRIGAMINLQTLSGVYAGGGIASALGNLTQLRKLGVKRVADDHATELSAAIMKMTKLVSLSIEAEGWGEDDIFPEFESFSPPPSIQELFLQGRLVEMPSWIASMENLSSLYLSFTYLRDNPTTDIQFLPNLKHLTLWKAYKAKRFGKEFIEVGGFRKLETLTIDSEFLVEWSEIAIGAFPSLRSLSLRNCIELRFFPEGLQNISTLEYLIVVPMHNDLERRLLGEEIYKIINIPHVMVLPL